MALVGASFVIVKLRVIFAYVRSKLWFWPRMRGEEINGGDIVKNQIFWSLLSRQQKSKLNQINWRASDDKCSGRVFVTRDRTAFLDTRPRHVSRVRSALMGLIYILYSRHRSGAGAVSRLWQLVLYVGKSGQQRLWITLCLIWHMIHESRDTTDTSII